MRFLKKLNYTDEERHIHENSNYSLMNVSLKS